MTLISYLLGVFGGFLVGFGLRGLIDFWRNKDVRGYKHLFVK